MKPTIQRITTTILLLLLSSFPFRSFAGADSRDAQIAAAAEGLRSKLVEQRRDFHMHPELSNREERTARIIAERLRALGLEDIKTGVGRHGITALLKGAKPGPVVA